MAAHRAQGVLDVLAESAGRLAGRGGSAFLLGTAGRNELESGRRAPRAAAALAAGAADDDPAREISATRSPSSRSS
jgi:hypothetical protein